MTICWFLCIQKCIVISNKNHGNFFIQNCFFLNLLFYIIFFSLSIIYHSKSMYIWETNKWFSKSTLSKNRIWISLFLFLIISLNLSPIAYVPHLLVIPPLSYSIPHILINLPFFLQNNTNNQFYYLFRKEIFIKSSKQI